MQIISDNFWNITLTMKKNEYRLIDTAFVVYTAPGLLFPQRKLHPAYVVLIWEDST